MVATNSMATRSSLELMLDKLQQMEDRPKDSPPALPVRPVSRARLPRARRPLQLDFQRRNCEEEEESDDGVAAQFDHSRKKIELSKNSEEIGISKIQKCYRGHRVRCYYNELRTGTIALQSFIRGENARRVYQDQTQVTHSVVVDLQKRVLRTEAKLREKNEQNIALKRQLEEMERKWRHYEERMKSMEKEWQDEFTHIQECAKDNNNRNRHYFTNGRSSDIQQQSDGNFYDQACLNFHPQEELRRLKRRFQTWNKDYKNKLRDAQSTLKKIGNSETAKTQKNWWGILSH